MAFTPAAVLGAKGVLRHAVLKGVSCAGALLPGDCCWLTQLLAGVSALPGAGLFSLLPLLQELATMDPLPPTEGLLPLLKGLLLVKDLSPLMQVLPAVGEGLAAVPRVASSLRLTEVTLVGSCEGETVLAVAGAGPLAEVEVVAIFEATASWRACADQKQH